MPTKNPEDRLALTRRDSLRLLGTGAVITALQAPATLAVEPKAADVVMAPGLPE